jgi:hypothetical protein
MAKCSHTENGNALERPHYSDDDASSKQAVAKHARRIKAKMMYKDE